MSPRPITPPSGQRQRGVGLLETLVALVVLALGLLGLAAMKAQVLRNSQSAMDRTQATLLSYQILDAMRANPIDARNGRYNMTMRCEIPGTPSTLVAHDLHYWMKSLKDNLGPRESTCGAIQCTDRSCTITIQWDDSRGTGGSSNQTLLTQGDL